MRIKRPSLWSKLVVIAAAGCLLIGLYVVAVTLAPTYQSLTVDPQNNPTVKKLAEPAPVITENRLYIPSIDLDVPYGQNESALYSGAWWRKPYNGNPADGGNFVLAGHRFVMSTTPGKTAQRSPFYSIGKLQVGDEIVIDYNQQRYRYLVDKIHTVAPDAIEIESRTDQPRLTLYSCTLGGSSDGRDVIVARQITD